MKYLDILKQYNKAIVTESQRLQKIYDKLLNEENLNGLDEITEKICDKCGKEVADYDCDGTATCTNEADDKKTMCEFPSESEEDKPVEEPNADVPKTEEPKKAKTGPLMTSDDFFKEPDASASEAPVAEDKKVTEKDVDDKTLEQFFSESEEATKAKEKPKKEEVKEEPKAEVADGEKKVDGNVDAATLFAEEEKPEEATKAKEKPKKEEVKEEPKAEEEPKKEAPKKEETVDEGCCKESNLADWVNSKLDENKEAAPTEEPSSEVTPTENELEEAEEQKQLQESINSIRQFVKANKRLFVG